MNIKSQIESLGKILGIWAHPDDETFSMGGLIAAANQNHQAVGCITATRGESGSQNMKDLSPQQLAGIRESELNDALECLGGADHFWLPYADGGCQTTPDTEAVERITSIIHQFQPDTIITFPPDGITGHTDHRTVSGWAKTAAQKCGVDRVYYVVTTKEAFDAHLAEADKKFNIFFNIDKPTLVPENQCDLLLKLPKQILNQKIAALKAMPSQTSAMFAEEDTGWLKPSFGCEAFVRSNRSDIKWG